MEDILNYSLEEFTEILENNGFKKFRGKQVYLGIFEKFNTVNKFNDINNIPKDLKEFLNENFILNPVSIYKKLISKYDETRKYLVKLEDNNIIECVLMKYNFGYSVCISSQVGCKMGCSFCASTVDSKIRDLSPSEMIGQILTIQKDIGQRISNIVIMGSGEPFDNYENIIKFLNLINSKDNLNIGARHITISTCGIADKIREFADLKSQVNLALSLHSTFQELREKIMPVAKKYSLKEVLEAIDYYIKNTKRRVTFEYAMIKGFNDRDEDLYNLIKICKNKLIHINLIPINDAKRGRFEKPLFNRINYFCNELNKNKIHATIRREMGSDINGACGQLKISQAKKETI